MTPDDRFGRTLSTWLHEEAGHRVPDHLAEVLVQTVATRQRPWWSSLERLAPMTTMTTGRVQARPPVFWFALIALVSLAAVGAVLLAGALRATPTPLGPASNGRIVVADGTTLYTYAPDGSDRRELLRMTGGGATTLSMSPDGTRVAFKVNTMPPRIQIVSIADGSLSEVKVLAANEIADEPLGWSPDGRSLVFAGWMGDRADLFVAAADDPSVRALVTDALDPNLVVWQPSYSPDGEWIAFAAWNKRTSFGSLYVVRPDGTGLRALSTPSVEAGDGGGPVWSPDASVHRIAYLTFHDDALYTRLFDLDADTDHEIGAGFWPSWSPDGRRLATCCANVVDVDTALAGDAASTTVFAPFTGACGDEPQKWTGRSICSAAVWSPDGRWLIAGDIAGRDLLIAPVDGSAPPRRLQMQSVSRFEGTRLPVAWQPVWP